MSEARAPTQSQNLTQNAQEEGRAAVKEFSRLKWRCLSALLCKGAQESTVSVSERGVCAKTVCGDAVCILHVSV